MISFVKNILQKTSLPELDGVRAFACLSVIQYHIIYLFSKQEHHLPIISDAPVFGILNAGWSGVTLFFVLSGFLLFLPYVRALLDSTILPAAGTFYLRRVLRILPAYYASLGLLILFSHPEFLQPDHLPGLGLFITFLMDAPLTYQRINGPFWTLAIEWQYYMLLPLLVWGFSFLVRRGKTGRQRLQLIIICLLAMLLWGLATRYVGRYYELHPNQTLWMPRPILDGILLVIYGSTGKYFEDFAIGMLIATLFATVRSQHAPIQLGRVLRQISLWLLAIGVMVLFFMCTWDGFPFKLSSLHPYIGTHNWLIELGYGLGFGLCVTGILFGPQWLKSACAWAPLRWIGTISFSLYIWHVPLMVWFRDMIIAPLHTGSLLTYALYWVSVYILITPVSFLSYRFIEQPWMQFSQRLRKKGNNQSQPG